MMPDDLARRTLARAERPPLIDDARSAARRMALYIRDCRAAYETHGDAIVTALKDLLPKPDKSGDVRTVIYGAPADAVAQFLVTFPLADSKEAAIEQLGTQLREASAAEQYGGWIPDVVRGAIRRAVEAHIAALTEDEIEAMRGYRDAIGHDAFYALVDEELGRLARAL